MNRALPSLHGGSLEITLTVSLNNNNFRSTERSYTVQQFQPLSVIDSRHSVQVGHLFSIPNIHGTGWTFIFNTLYIKYRLSNKHGN